jgi:hypothetical protein
MPACFPATSSCKLSCKRLTLMPAQVHHTVLQHACMPLQMPECRLQPHLFPATGKPPKLCKLLKAETIATASFNELEQASHPLRALPGRSCPHRCPTPAEFCSMHACLPTTARVCAYKFPSLQAAGAAARAFVSSCKLLTVHNVDSTLTLCALCQVIMPAQVPHTGLLASTQTLVLWQCSVS